MVYGCNPITHQMFGFFIESFDLNTKVQSIFNICVDLDLDFYIQFWLLFSYNNSFYFIEFLGRISSV